MSPYGPREHLRTRAPEVPRDVPVRLSEASTGESPSVRRKYGKYPFGPLGLDHVWQTWPLPTGAVAGATRSSARYLVPRTATSLKLDRRTTRRPRERDSTGRIFSAYLGSQLAPGSWLASSLVFFTSKTNTPIRCDSSRSLRNECRETNTAPHPTGDAFPGDGDGLIERRRGRLGVASFYGDGRRIWNSRLRRIYRGARSYITVAGDPKRRLRNRLWIRGQVPVDRKRASALNR